MSENPAPSPAGGGAQRTVRVGSDIGSYRIDEVIARGGMSVVYRATDRRLGRPVALKVLVSEPGGASAEMRARFLREALDVAHASELVHRDVKPSNILLGRGADTDAPGHVYLTDFGVSRTVSASTRLTSAGNVIGTVSYMAPEQITGRGLDARTDLYGLGCVAYECLTGEPPFVRDEQAALLWAHVNERPAAVSTHRPELHTVDRVLARALAKQPADRYRTCTQFIAALAASLVENPPTGTGSAIGTVAGPAVPLPSVARSGPPRATVRVFLVDDHELVRKGVADVLSQSDDLMVVGEGVVRRRGARRHPCSSTGCRRPGHAAAGRQRHRAVPRTSLADAGSALPDADRARRRPGLLTVILAGASGHAIKDITGSDLVTAVRTVGAGRSLADSRTVEALIGRFRADAEPAGRLAALTPRERTVLSLVGEGLTNRQIGRRMSLSEGTVKNHVSHLLDKLGVSRRRQAAELLHRAGDSGEHRTH